MKKNTILTFCLSLFLVGSLFSQNYTTFYVSADGAGDKTGVSEATAFDNFTTALGTYMILNPQKAQASSPADPGTGF